MDRAPALKPEQEKVLEQFQRKFAKVGITTDPRLRMQFLWLWRRILRTYESTRRTRTRAAKRASEIEEGTYRAGQAPKLTANDTPPGVPAFSPDRCPSCDRLMKYFPARKAYLCLECQ